MTSLMVNAVGKELEKVLRSRGVPGGDFLHSKDGFDAGELLCSYETNIFGMPPKTISIIKQERALERVLENPLSTNYVMGISSFPSDALAKHLAITIMKKACEKWASSSRRRGKIMPTWHRVFGGFNDALRDNKGEDNLSMLIISNVNELSSAYKMEKVRDLLEKYSEIPRIVVLSGEDPISFFANRMHFPINIGIRLGPANRIKSL